MRGTKEAGLVKQSMREYITRIKEILTLDALEVGCYIAFMVILTGISNFCANSRCFNPVFPKFEEQNKILADYETGPALNRQLKHLKWIMEHDKEIKNVR
jgi:hypothetical protein